MLMIKLVDARKGLHEKCLELFHNEKVAENIYMYLCDGIEECDAVKTERKKGKWIRTRTMIHDGELYCNICEQEHPEQKIIWNFCPNCGADMRGEQDE